MSYSSVYYLCTMGRAQEHNRELIRSAEYRASEMQSWPSPLEQMMKDVLDNSGIKYEEQKIFYIHADDGWIIRYYIADFYIPHKRIIIEVDGRFHDNQKQKDKTRTKTIQEEYDVGVLRFKWNDVKSKKKMRELVQKLL